MNIKMQMYNDLLLLGNDLITAKYLVVAVKLASGKIELIINSEDIEQKLHYYVNSYDAEMQLKRNPQIQIVNYMLVKEEK